MLIDTFITALVKKFLGKEFVPRYIKYPVIFPDYLLPVIYRLLDFIYKALSGKSGWA